MEDYITMALFTKKKPEVAKPLTQDDAHALLLLKINYAIEDYLKVGKGNEAVNVSKEREHVLAVMARLESDFRTMFQNTHSLQGALTAMSELRKRL